MNILAYVHLRNIHGSTGTGRVAKNIVEKLVANTADSVHILADRNDYRKGISKIGPPWTDYDYHFFDADTSAQQRRWVFLNSPPAEAFWPDVEQVYCAGESYVPTRRARSVVLLHDAAFFDDNAHTKDLSFYFQQLKWRVLYARLCRDVNLIHTVSNFSAERIGYHFPSLKPRIRVIHNGVTDFFFSRDNSNDKDLLARWGLVDRPYILLPRGLSFRKNGDLVLEAWPLVRQRHPDLALVVTSHNDASYIAKAESLGAGVIMTGFVEDEELRALYRGSSAVWFPSRYEGFGLPILEAMACGAPVIASDASSLPEIAGDAALFVPVLDAAAHVAAIDEMLTGGKTRNDYIAKGHARAAMFPWDEAARKLRTMFKELA